MKKSILTAVLATLWLGACAQPMMRPQGPLNEFSAMEGTTALQYNLPMERNIESRAGYGPAFYIFPDQKLDESTALTLARELKIIDLAAQNGGRICVVNPAGNQWQASDVQAFHDLINHGGPGKGIQIIASETENRLPDGKGIGKIAARGKPFSLNHPENTSRKGNHMEKEKIERINELARKRKTVGLTDEEKKEQDDLRKEYIAGFRSNLQELLDSVTVQEPDGTRHKLQKKI